MGRPRKLAPAAEGNSEAAIHERPPLPPGAAQRLILEEPEAAEFLGMPRPKFREMSASGEIPRICYGPKSYRYYVYDLLDWALSRRS